MTTTGRFVARSLLSVPGSEPERVGKAHASGADQVVVDLEDSVSPDRKAEARNGLPRTLGELDRSGPAKPGIAVRINAIGTEWFLDDVRAVVGCPDVTSVMLPKTESSRDLHALEAVLASAEAAAGRTDPLTVLALIETAAGLDQLPDITAASLRTVGLVLGYADMTVSLGRRRREAGFEALWLPVQSALVTAARAAGIAAIDGPWLGVADDEPFRAAAEQGAALGFDATWVIHPRQVATANRLHTPTAEDVQRASRITEALQATRAAGGGAVRLDGQMLDEAVAKWATAVLERARRSGSP